MNNYINRLLNKIYETFQNWNSALDAKFDCPEQNEFN